ncbi:hypothetical protein [Peristeroidobacter soli]|uniref:hypothetical protein n=1 Tax=Peristeroidobacter soli TaxID=2497877 RepID=UPI00101C1CAF|nr:hypothetical protein [Peristeroidobacter soli]
MLSLKRIFGMIATAAALACGVVAHAGPVLQGPVLNGPVLQGPVLQGPVLQGPVLQGPVLQGPALNSQTIGRPVAVTLPNGETIAVR